MHKQEKKIAVIGSGVAGVTAAYYLARAGHRVAVYDSELWPAMKCSHANGGQLSVSNSETWHSWSNVVKGLKWLTKKDAPLLIRPSLDPAKLAWLGRFLWHTATGVRRENTLKTIALGIQARGLYQQIIQEERLEFSYKNSGILHFYRNEEYFEAARQLGDIYGQGGCEWTIMDTAGVHKIEPTLRRSTDIVGGIWTSADSVGDIHQFCTNLAQVCMEKYGVVFRHGIEIHKQNFRDITALYDAVVVSAGAETPRLARYLGDRCTIYPVKGYSITLEIDEQDTAPSTSLLDDEAKIVTSTLGNKLRVAGTAELCGYNYDIRSDRIGPLLGWVERHFPDVRTNNYKPWACLRPMTSDMMPMVGRSKQRGVYYHTGHGHLGWTLAPATAQQLVDQIQNDI